MGDCHRYLVRGHKDLVDTAEFVAGFLAVDAVEDEAALGVEEETESVAAFFEFNDVHESGGEVVVCADLAVDLDASFHTDLHALFVGEGVL
mmetsp:Transcript_3917/g.5277  ORF Transcript_3917/g.5277 Transcript_3917/m.5277 type:complete len:91 (-) Transcript_3917:320-592(-)